MTLEGGRSQHLCLLVESSPLTPTLPHPGRWAFLRSPTGPTACPWEPIMLIAIRTACIIDIIPFIGWAVGITFLIGALR